MHEYHFTLKFAVPADEDLEALSAHLYENGCDDVVIGIGIPGRIALSFERESTSADKAVLSALENVKNIAPQAKLTEAAPDLVGATDIAEILNCSRQNVQKMIVSKKNNFPSPAYIDAGCGNRIALWHLSSVLEWLKENEKFVDEVLYDLASTTLTINFANKPANYKMELEDRIRELVV